MTVKVSKSMEEINDSICIKPAETDEELCGRGICALYCMAGSLQRYRK